MKYDDLALDGVVLITPEPVSDTRGFFARLLDREEMRTRGLRASFEQESMASNSRAGTIRGLHYQRAPHAETKIIRCIKGAIYDVVVDIRPQSATFGRWVAVVLDALSRAALYVPPGFAHGYQTLESETEVFYHIDPAYQPSAAAGIHHADPTLRITWPIADKVVSERDMQLPAMA